MRDPRVLRGLGYLTIACSLCAGCSSGTDASPPDGDIDADAAVPPPDAADGLAVSFDDPVEAQEYRGLIPVQIRIDSPLAALREAGVEIEGTRHVLCSDWPVVLGLRCGGGLGVWEEELAAGVHTLRAFATDVAGHTATAEMAVTVRPYVRPRWEFAAKLAIEPPVIAGDVVLAPADKLYALGRDDGALRWTYDPDLGGPFDSIRGVVADEARAYAVTSRDAAEVLVALDLATGAVAWEVTLPGVELARPVFDGEQHIVIADTASDLQAYTRDGALAWSVDLAGNGDHIPAHQPVIGPDGTIFEMPPGADALVHISAAGSVLETIPLEHDWHSGFTIADDGAIYSADDDGLRVYAAGGGLLRFLPTPGHVVEPVRFGTDHRVYLAAELGGVFVLGADGSVLWDLPMPDLLRGTPFEAPDGTLFIGALGRDLAYRYTTAGAQLDEYPYCDQPDGFTADSDLVICTRHARIYAMDLAAFPER
jgi:outer membrane protein assembly factor BamB